MIFQRWSEQLWETIHFLSIQCDVYKDQNTIEFTEYFLNNLYKIMDCEFCKIHFIDYVQQNPISKPYFEWGLNLRNDINRINNKPIIELNQLKLKYETIINGYS